MLNCSLDTLYLGETSLMASCVKKFKNGEVLVFVPFGERIGAFERASGRKVKRGGVEGSGKVEVERVNSCSQN